MHFSKLKKISLAVIIALSVTSANAAVTIIKEHDVVNEKVEARFSQVGLSGEHADVIHGYGDDMPFDIAMDIIVPEGWYISHNEGAQELSVNWIGNVTWPYVLKNLSETNNISVSINWEKKNIDFFSHDAHKSELLKEKDVNDILSIVNQEQNNIKNVYLLEKEKELKNKYELASRITQEKLLAQQEAEKENNKYIKMLEAQKDQLEKEKNDILLALEEQELNKDKYIAQNNNTPHINQDAIQLDDTAALEKELAVLDVPALKGRYDDRFVLPLESSFEFFIKGGYAQDFDYFTPATFIAKGNAKLSDNIKKWVSATGWKLKWNTNLDYNVEYNLRFEGTLKETSTSLILLYNEDEHTKRKLDIDFYPMQELVVVSDLKYK